jgi:hypothetical protein
MEQNKTLKKITPSLTGNEKRRDGGAGAFCCPSVCIC